MASSYTWSCGWTRGSTSSTPPRWAGGGGGKVVFFYDFDELRAAPLECLDGLEEGLRAFAMERMLTEPVSRVNGCARRHFGGQEPAGVTERRHEPKIARGVRGGIADTVYGVSLKVTRGAGMLADLRRLGYKLVAEPELATKCL